jgi:hypothetical protein
MNIRVASRSHSRVTVKLLPSATITAASMSYESPSRKASPKTPFPNPPSYNESDPASVLSSSLEFPAPGLAHNFGPTPLPTQALAPYAYYDARSPYSLGQADTRARWRFISGFLCALGMWFMVGCLIGVGLGWSQLRHILMARDR